MDSAAGRGGPETWMLFSYFFNVDAKACSQHLDSRIPYMASSGIKPVVLSGICGERSKSGEHYRVSSVAPSGVRFELRYLKRRNRFFKLAAAPLLVAILPLYLLEKMLINLESEWSWFLPAFLRGLLLHRRFGFTLIYSTGGPPCAHLAAGILARCIKRPWIAELQDPIVFTDWNRSGRALKIHAWLERFILKNASAVVFLTEGARERALARNKVDGRKVHVIYPGACAAEAPEATYRKKEFCRFSHFGSLAGSRNPEKFLEAISLLLDEHPDLVEKVRLEFYGAMDTPSRKAISRFKYRDIVADLGKVSWSEALKAMRETDVLVVIQNRDELSYETIPSKFYEYLQAKRPILGIVYKNPPLQEMLLSQGHFAAEADSPSQISEQAARILEDWGNSATQTFPESPYTVSEATKQLLALCRERGEMTQSTPRNSPSIVPRGGI